MDFHTFLQAAHVGIAIATFLVCIWKVDPSKFRAPGSIGVAMVLVLMGIAVNGIGVRLGFIRSGELVAVLTMSRESIWHGTTILAVAYGLLSYSLFRLIFGVRSRVE